MSIPAKTRKALHERAEQRCEMCGAFRANNAHHRRNKSQGGRDVLSNLLLLCGSGTTGCHGWVTTHPDASAKLGLTIKGTAAVPADVKVWRGGFGTWASRWFFLRDDGSVIPASQVEIAQ